MQLLFNLEVMLVLELQPSAKLHVNVGNSSTDKSKLALNVYKDFNGDNGNYAARTCIRS